MSIDDNDYFMGVAFISIYRANHQNCMICVDAHDNFKVCTGSIDDDSLLPHLFLASTTSYGNPTSVFLTYTPDYLCVQMLANSGVKKIIFYQTLILEDFIFSFCSAQGIEIKKFNGNLNWIRDHIFYLRSKDIL